MVRESFDVGFIITILPKLLRALPLTLGILAASILLGCLLGLLLAWIKVCGARALKAPVNALTTLLRAIPDVVLLYIVYFGLPVAAKAAFGLTLSSWPKPVFVMLALSLGLSATASEMFRSAYNSLEKGQLEAAHAIGMTGRQRFRRIIFPQGLYVILPNLASACIAITQATALAYTLGVMDIMGKARVLDTNTGNLKTFEAYLSVALLYWGMSLFISAVFKGLEAKFGKGLRTLAAAAK